ncbi:MAG: hypothetical protein HON98_06255 [Chloroflexi bacterium]|jgi:hypothetical protein|nr:hypothetical protein [Chloroflexota bacterium]MBT3669499.1 hypothetical protein [Chloroflexota bacterium]MBT4002436.1 hypothetical protein [Chloroflexota bacterium]MBT4304482.1 hypothetical protein [Chloroflexota bacterium]MBT4534177.1 hypothetical protein [Chloroflexota bacterium]
MQNQPEEHEKINSENDEIQDDSPEIKDLVRESQESNTGLKIGTMNLSKFILYGVLSFIVIVLLASLSGYWKGITDRVNYQDQLVSTEASDQLVRAIMDMDSGNYSQAVTRLEYIIGLDPNFPGAADFLAQSLVILANPSPTPTVTPTPTITPTPTQDLGNIESLFNHAVSLGQAENWDELLSTLDQIRYIDIGYKTNEVNTLYFNALRNRGVNKILQDGLLESGIFDLNNAENYGVLDVQATNLRQWSEWYITGASFWAVDWVQTITYFQYIVPHAPNLMDSTFFFAKDRLATAEVIYPTEAVLRASNYLEQELYCEAHEIFDYVITFYGPLSEEYEDPSFIANNRCEDLLGTQQAP